MTKFTYIVALHADKNCCKKNCFYYKFAKTPKKMGLMTFLKFKLVRFSYMKIYLKKQISILEVFLKNYLILLEECYEFQTLYKIVNFGILTNLKTKFCFDKFIFPLNAIIFEYNIDCNASSVQRNAFERLCLSLTAESCTSLQAAVTVFEILLEVLY